jgi:calcineurin-like phosphoesterase family protein
MFDAYWSDPHFGHKMLIERGYRPFGSIQEMNRELVHNYNRVIKPDMTVAWLGDCFLTVMPVCGEIMSALNGRKFLIWGGHDRSFSAMLRMGFSGVTYTMDVRIAGITCTLCHFPYSGTPKHDSKEVDERFPEMRPRKKRGQVLIHGHTHQQKKVKDRCINVCVDAWDFAPAMEHEIYDLVEEMQIK